jgi:thioredoxin-like negative regulator of GroEL
LSKNDPQVPFAKVDLTQEKGLAKAFGVTDTPTVWYSRRGEKIKYTGLRTKDTIAAWVLK